MTTGTVVGETARSSHLAPVIARGLDVVGFGARTGVRWRPLSPDTGVAATLSGSVWAVPGVLTTASVDARVGGVLECNDDEVLAVVTVLRGELHVEGGDRTFGAGDVVVLGGLGLKGATHPADARLLVVTLPSASVVAAASASGIGPSPGIHLPEVGPRPGLDARWRESSAMVDSMLREADDAAALLLVGPAAQLLATVALTVFDLDPRPPTPVAAPVTTATLRLAVAYIEAHPHLDISVAQIAAAAFVTPRALQLSFRRHLDTTPMAYLRTLRLGLADDDLWAALPDDGETVGAVAARWGFTSSGLTRVYREAYGRPPSETLHAAPADRPTQERAGGLSGSW